MNKAHVRDEVVTFSCRAEYDKASYSAMVDAVIISEAMLEMRKRFPEALEYKVRMPAATFLGNFGRS